MLWKKRFKNTVLTSLGGSQAALFFRLWIKSHFLYLCIERGFDKEEKRSATTKHADYYCGGITNAARTVAVRYTTPGR